MKTVAHVGYTKTRGDLSRTVEAMEWLQERKIFLPFPLELDFVELRKGRDFLAESKRYDIVILHHIFRGGFTVRDTKNKQLATSSLSSWATWRKRLVATGAKFIFAFGGLAEVGGTFIVNLDGYTVHKIRTPDQSQFGKVEGHDGLWIFEKA